MCFADGSLAPAAPGAGTAGSSRALTLTSADGTVLMAHETRAATPSGVGFVVLPDIRGLHHYYRDLTVRLAELGWDSVAIDYFGRTAKDDDRSDAFEWMPHIAETRPPTVAADVQAGVAHLRGLGVERIFTIGFCFGGGFSWRQSADTPGLAGCVGFYGGERFLGDSPEQTVAPVLMLQAGIDDNIPLEMSERIRDRMAAPAQLEVFEGCPHSFFDRTAPQHADACVQAWELIQGFVAANA